VAADQSAASAPSSDQSAGAASADANATDTTTTAKNEGLPQTASPLPLLGLMGFGSMVTGYFARKRK
jgi:LPXTG-motif cell wall-anchored protein